MSNNLSNLTFFTIVGVGRSGTTLLMSMLNAHPDIALPPETHFLEEYVIKYPYATLSEALRHISEDHRFARLQLSREQIAGAFSGREGEFSVAKLYRMIMAFYASEKGVYIIGDKAPKNIEYLPTLKHIFPDVFVFHLIRDPRDVYLSRTKAEWSSSYPDVLQLLAYRAQYDLGCRLGPQLFGRRYHEVHYENLLTKPRIELRKICSLLDVPFDEAMLEFSDSAKELVFPEEMSWKKETIGPLLISNMNKWRAELSHGKTMRIEAACSPTFQNGFYQVSRNEKSMEVSLIDSAINIGMGFLAVLYRQFVLFKNWRAKRAIKRQSI